jgi:hypothetical protein
VKRPLMVLIHPTWAASLDEEVDGELRQSVKAVGPGRHGSEAADGDSEDAGELRKARRNGEACRGTRDGTNDAGKGRSRDRGWGSAQNSGTPTSEEGNNIGAREAVEGKDSRSELIDFGGVGRVASHFPNEIANDVDDIFAGKDQAKGHSFTCERLGDAAVEMWYATPA